MMAASEPVTGKRTGTGRVPVTGKFEDAAMRMRHDPLRGILARVVRAQKLDPYGPAPACAFGVYVGKRLDHIEDLCTWILRTLLAGVLVEVLTKFLR